LGEDWARRNASEWAAGIESISDEALWRSHSLLRQKLIAFLRERVSRNQNGEGDAVKEPETQRLNPDALTIGFARRVAEYKRWALPVTDPARFLQLLHDADRPVQFVFSGKAHPQDQGAKIILQRVAKWAADPLLRDRVVFLEDYDQEIARQLVQSVDVWLNVPRRPFEASGTSGEKVAINGGLNFSVLDGWWLEGYDGTNGFAIGDLSEGETNADAADAESFYSVLEKQIVPLYYDRDADGIPHRWVAMMRRSIATLVPQFNSDRMVAEYAERIYLQE